MSELIEIIAVAFSVLLTALVTPAGARIVGAPEIDPSVASSAIALLACGLLSLTARRKRRKEDRRRKTEGRSLR